jgi:hypothetical protein
MGKDNTTRRQMKKTNAGRKGLGIAIQVAAHLFLRWGSLQGSKSKGKTGAIILILWCKYFFKFYYLKRYFIFCCEAVTLLATIQPFPFSNLFHSRHIFSKILLF